METEDKPQSVEGGNMLTEEEVIKWGTEIFKRSIALQEKWATEYPGSFQNFPVSYCIYGADFYLFGLHKGVAVAPNTIHPYDPRNPHHQAGMQIAFWIYGQLEIAQDAVVIEENKEIPEYIIDDENAVIEIYNQIISVKDNPLYPYLPGWYLEKLAVAKEAYTKRCAGYIRSLKLTEMRRSPKHGFVCLVQSSTGSYKIGRSKNPDNRMKTFGVQLPFEVDYVCTIESADMYALEVELHRQYASKRLNGEWFMLSPEDVAAIQGLAVSL